MTKMELEQCIAAYGKDIYSFCKGLAKSTPEAEDLYQDTFLKAVELGGKIDSGGNPKSYLLSIAIRIWKNRKRKYAWRNRIAGMDSFAEGQEDKAADEEAGTSPETIFLCREEQKAVRQAVGRLPEKYRLVVLLFYMEELSVDEIGAVLKIPAGTVKSRLHHARKQLERELEDVFYET